MMARGPSIPWHGSANSPGRQALTSRPRQLAAIALVGALFAMLVTGCTVLGFGAGAIVDQLRPTRYDPHAPEWITETSLETPVVLVLRDSTRILGRYQGVEPGESAGQSASSDSSRIPAAQRIAIRAANGTTGTIAIDSIAYLAVAAPKHGKLVGVLLGLCVDIGIAVYYAYFAQWD
jgi:hypothetical protein